MTKLLLFASVCLVFMYSVPGRCEDWPQYRGAAGDGKSAESISDLSAKKWKVLWKTETPLGFSSFSIADDRAFTIVMRSASGGGKVETLVALDANSGDELWNAKVGSGDYKQGGGNAGAPDNKGGDGPRSTPTVDGDRVFTYGAFMMLSCFDASTGKRIWSQNILNDYAGRDIKWHNGTSPLLVDDKIVVGGGGAGQSFLAFERATGKLAWKSGDETITHSTPFRTKINSVDQVIFLAQSGLVGVDVTTGKELWRAKFPFSTSAAASPVGQGDLVYCSAGYGVGAGLFQIKDGEAIERWFKPNELMNHWSTPVIHNGHLYGIFEFKKYGKAPLQCVELATGEIKWAERGFGPGNCILVGDRLVVLSDAGVLVIVEARPDHYNELSRQKVLDGKCWSTPAFSDGRVYVRSTKEAACVSVD